MDALNRFSPVSELSGVGKTRAAQLERLGIRTLEDLVYYFPRAYENRGDERLLSKCDFDSPTSFILTVGTVVKTANIRRGLSISKFRAFDESGSVEITYFNTPFAKDVFKLGSVFRFYGKPSLNKKKLELTNPKYEPYVEGHPLPSLIPIYPETKGLSSKQIDKLVRMAISAVIPTIEDPLPEWIRLEHSLPTLTTALLGAHFPSDEKSLAKSLERLAFDEMLIFGLGISLSASRRSRGEGIKFLPSSLSPITELLPYELTDSQKNAVNDIYQDTVIGKDGKVSPMARIIVGDVGCGKTVCAMMAMYIAVKSGYQTALMVPTEILARQHFAEAKELFSKLGISVELILGQTGAKEKKRIHSDISSGKAQIIIGTHALISDKISFYNLGLVITDEQHRFGVAQRALLKEKASSVHMLVMSATPIPRTLALTMYGDLDVSRITEMPKGRMKVDTYVVDSTYRERLNDFIRKQVTLGGQCYVVCPSIEAAEDENSLVTDGIGTMVPSRSLNLKNAVEYTEELKIAIPTARIATLHGRMKAAEKDEVMQAFSAGEIDILVSTTVIEVGVNGPSATLMVVENAERFGLSQLHQLRGRVGRGNKKSYCILVSDLKSEKSLMRLDTMRTTYDGYEISEKDLVIRGPGEFFSSNSNTNLRQSGGFEFKFASMCQSSELYGAAFGAAKSIVKNDPELTLPEHRLLKDEIYKKFAPSDSTIS